MKKFVLTYSHFPGKLLIINNIIIEMFVYSYPAIFTGNNSDIVWKRWRVLRVAILIFNALRMLNMYLLNLHNGKPLYKVKDV